MGRAKLACVIARDAADRILYGRYTGTPQAHLDRISEFFGVSAEPERQDARLGQEDQRWR